MPTSAPGNRHRLTRGPRAPSRRRGFTLIELLVVLAIIAIATAGVGLAMRDGSATRLDREARRLSALFESARAQSRMTGVAVVWHAVQGGFRFEGVPEGTLPAGWLHEGTMVHSAGRIVLGPEPIIGPQAVVLGSTEAPQRTLRIATDGVRPFTIEEPGAP
jgi:general secretion pathway protein H